MNASCMSSCGLFVYNPPTPIATRRALLLLTFCLTSTEARLLIRDGDRGKGARE